MLLLGSQKRRRLHRPPPEQPLGAPPQPATSVSAKCNSLVYPPTPSSRRNTRLANKRLFNMACERLCTSTSSGQCRSRHGTHNARDVREKDMTRLRRSVALARATAT